MAKTRKSSRRTRRKGGRILRIRVPGLTLRRKRTIGVAPQARAVRVVTPAAYAPQQARRGKRFLSQGNQAIVTA